MIKKLFALLLVVGVLTGCETVSSVTENAAELQANTLAKVAEIQTSIQNVVGEAKNAYATLLEKKSELEETIAKINEAVDAANKLLGRDDVDTAETEDLKKTIADLQAALAAAESTLGEVSATEENFQAETTTEQN